MQAVEVLKANLVLKIYDSRSFENAVALDMAFGGSSNTALHLPAIAHEAGVPLSWMTSMKRRTKTMNLVCSLKSR